MKRPDRLPLWRLAAFGAIAAPLSTIGLPLSIYLAPFYSGELGIPLSSLGIAMILARGADVVVDPSIGALSDRLRTPFGRRRVWIPIGALALVVGVWFLFRPPAGADVLYFTLWVTIVYLGYTLVQLPHSAWGGELSTDYNERTRIMAVRQAFSMIGLIAATALPAIVLQRQGATAGDVLASLAVLMAILLPIAAALAILFVPEPAAGPQEPLVGFVKGARAALRNGPFRLIVAALFLGYLAETFRITITLFFARDVVGVPNVGVIYAYYFIVGLAAVPFWGWLAARIGKHRALAGAFAIVVATNLAVFFLQHGQVTAFIVIFMAKGFCFGALELLPSALVADAVDVDSARSRTQRQGVFFAFTAMTNKIAQALGQGLSLLLLSVVGYNAAGGNGPAQLHALKALYGLAPAAALAPALLIMWTYPLTAARHARLRAALDRRSAREAPR